METDLSKFTDMAQNMEILVEECAEVIQIKSKIVRFGLYDKHPVTKIVNRDALVQEIGDVMAMIEILSYQGLLDFQELIDAKQIKLDKLEKFYNYPK